MNNCSTKINQHPNMIVTVSTNTENKTYYTVAPIIISENLKEDLYHLIEGAKEHQIPVIILAVDNEKDGYNLLLQNHPAVKCSRVQLLITASVSLAKHVSYIESTCTIGLSDDIKKRKELKLFGAYMVGKNIYKILKDLGLKKYYQLPYIAHTAHKNMKNRNKIGYPLACNDRLTGTFENNSQWISDDNKRDKLVPREILGIRSGSLAESYMNNAGSPYVPSKSFAHDVRDLEQHILHMLANHFQMHTKESGFVTTGGTEGNFTGIWYARDWLIIQMQEKTTQFINDREILEKHISGLKIKLNTIIQGFRCNNSSTSVSTISSDNIFLKAFEMLEQIFAKEKEREILTANIHDSTHPTLFYSDFAHYSITKIAGQLLLDGSKINYVTIKVDEHGAMDMEDFSRVVSIHMQEKPYSPIIVNANAGTTKTGAYDNISQISNILENIVENNGGKFVIHIDGALYGAILPEICPPGYPINIFKVPGVKSIAISGHKFFGSVVTNGVFLTTLEHEKEVFPNTPVIAYADGIHDTTPSGSRSGFSVLSLHNTFCALDMHRDFLILKNLVEICKKHTEIFIQEIISRTNIMKDEIKHTPYTFHVSFPIKLRKESQEYLMQKYSLMPLGKDYYSANILPNINKKLINRFIDDYVKKMKMEPAILALPQLEL